MVTGWDIVLEITGDSDTNSGQTALPYNKKGIIKLYDNIQGDNGPQKGFRTSAIGIQKLTSFFINVKDIPIVFQANSQRQICRILSPLPRLQ